MVETTWRHVSGRTLTDEAMHGAFQAFYDALRGPVAVGGVGGLGTVRDQRLTGPARAGPDRLGRTVRPLRLAGARRLGLRLARANQG